MRFEFQKANIIDRNPSPTASGINAAAAILWGSGSLFANATVLLASYPAPPLDFVASPHVETLWNRCHFSKPFPQGFSKPFPHPGGRPLFSAYGILSTLSKSFSA